jgi:uncharacterized protein (DUF2384 family)
MSGPSKIIVIPLTKLIFKVLPHSKLHNKFKFDEKEAFKEIYELIAVRNYNRDKLINEKTSSDDN